MVLFRILLVVSSFIATENKSTKAPSQQKVTWLSSLMVEEGGTSISCQLCVSSNPMSCTGVNVLCPESYYCGLKYTNTTINGSSTIVYTRQCSPEAQCNITGSMTVPNGTVQISTSCCYNDSCTPEIPTLSKNIDNSTNGVTCRSCLTVTSDWCYTSNTVSCTGAETKCLLQTTVLTGTQQVAVAMRGCATPDICSFGSQSFSLTDFTSSSNYICTNGSKRLYTGSTLVLLLFLKYAL